MGLDLQKDTQLRLALEDDRLITKLTTELSRWYAVGAPRYVKSARIILLSKTPSQYPPVGSVRPIAILPAISKLYEQIILHRLQEEFSKLCHPLHP